MAEGPASGGASSSATAGKILGALHEFRPEEERFTVYLERVTIFFAVNDIPAEKKVPLLLNAIGGKTYGVLRNLMAPDNPINKTFEEITGKLTEHFDPKPLIVMERYYFHKRDQAAEESVAEYMAELRRLAGKCQFETHLEDALRDRLVCGLRNEHMQRGLLTEADLNLEKAIKRATAMEAAHAHRTQNGGRQLIHNVHTLIYYHVHMRTSTADTSVYITVHIHYTIHKRVTAQEGERIPLGCRDVLGTSVIPRGHVWLEGDNRYLSYDSRDHGAIPLALVQGRVWYKVCVTPHLMRIEDTPP